jgi:hypothetical protein
MSSTGRGGPHVCTRESLARTECLAREAPDFSPLDFSQRFTGTISDDGRTISGHWEISTDGVEWDHDFALTSTKVT